MARIAFGADLADEQAKGGGGGNKFPVNPRGVYWLQIMKSELGKTSEEAQNPGVPKLSLILETDHNVDDPDNTEMAGKKVWHTVTLIPRGNGEKAAKGHGIAVHFLKAAKIPYDGKTFNFDDQDLIKEKHCMIQAFLEVEEYVSKQKDSQGQPFINEKNVIREIYTDTNPAPKSREEWPPEPKKKDLRLAVGASAARTDIEEVPF